jgi:hypothetical protein
MPIPSERPTARTMAGDHGITTPHVCSTNHDHTEQSWETIRSGAPLMEWNMMRACHRVAMAAGTVQGNDNTEGTL